MAPIQKLPKIILIHGLNNNLESFYGMRDYFISLGFEVNMIRLPGHDENREDMFLYERAMRVFDERVSPLTEDPYIVMAFSLGALYYELWEKKNGVKASKKLYLAPAFAIKNLALIKRLVEFLPSEFPIRSFMPKFARNRSFLFIKEYKILLQGVKDFSQNFEVSGDVLILLDPKDELVDSGYILKNWKNHDQIQVINRPYLKNLRGHHHMIFHPDYFSDVDWKNFQNLLEDFILPKSKKAFL